MSVDVLREKTWNALQKQEELGRAVETCGMFPLGMTRKLEDMVKQELDENKQGQEPWPTRLGEKKPPVEDVNDSRPELNGGCSGTSSISETKGLVYKVEQDPLMYLAGDPLWLVQAEQTDRFLNRDTIRGAVSCMKTRKTTCWTTDDLPGVVTAGTDLAQAIAREISWKEISHLAQQETRCHQVNS